MRSAIWWRVVVAIVCHWAWGASSSAHPSLWPEVAEPYELRDALRSFGQLRRGEETDLQSAEAIGRNLLHDFPNHEGVILFELAHIHAQAGLKQPEIVIDYCRQALAKLGPTHLPRRAAAYVYLGDAVRRRAATEGMAFPELRRSASELYLDGLAELASLDLPETPPRIPVPAFAHIDLPNVDSTEAERRFNEGQEQTRREIETIQQLCRHRDVLIRQIASLYTKRPPARSELENLVDEHLPGGQFREKLLAGVPDVQPEAVHGGMDVPNQRDTLRVIILANVIAISGIAVVLWIRARIRRVQ